MSDIKYAYYESSVGYKITGKTTTDVLVSGGSKPLSEFFHTGNMPPDTNTTYSAGTGLSLSGTTFGQTITTSGTGTFVTGITQTANGFQVNLGTPPNTTYSAGNGITLSGTVFSMGVTITGTGNVVSSVTQSAGGITVDKGITAATTTDLGNYIPLAQRGAPSGVATLDASGLIPSGQLPSYVDDIIEAANITALNALPAGDKVAGKIYVTLDNNKTYRWGGTAFVEVSSGAISTATAAAHGIVKLGSDTPQTQAANAVTNTASRSYAVQLNAVGQMLVNVPWVDTNTDTTYTGSTSITLTAGSFQRAALTGDVEAAANANATTIKAGVVSNTKLANMAANTIKGAVVAGAPVDLTPAQVKTMLGIDVITDSQAAGSAVTKTITHNWNTRRVEVTIVDTVTFYKVDARIKMTTVNSVSIEFDTAPPNALEITVRKLT